MEEILGGALAVIALIFILSIGISAFALFIVWVVLPLGALALLIWGGMWLYKLNNERVAFEQSQQLENQKQLDLKQADADRFKEIEELYSQVNYPIPTAQHFVDMLANALRRKTHDLPHDRLTLLCNAAYPIYARETASYYALPPLPKKFDSIAHETAYKQRLAEHKQRFDNFKLDLVVEALASSLAVFWSLYPREQGQFTLPLSQLNATATNIVASMCNPFWEQDLAARNLLTEMRDTQRKGAEVAAGRKSSSAIIWSHEYKGEDAYKLYLPKEFWPLFDLPVATSLTDKQRFNHEWVMAPQGTGKTVLLSNQINLDLDRVARGECSVFVMDSQDRELGKFLPRLARFAPGGDLHGRLIYLEPDHQHPLALNPFDFTNSTPAEVEQSIIIFMSAFEPPTDRMRTIISYAMRALALIPNTNMLHFKTLLRAPTRKEPSGFQSLERQYPQLRKLDQTAHTFFSEGLYSQGYAQSLSGLQARLDLFLADAFFERMFTSETSPIDLGDMLSRPNVVVVNTKAKLTRDRLKAFGLYFIGKLIQAYQSRMDEDAPIPCFAYIDEVGDYVKENPQIAEIFWKARKQNFGMIVAHQDITNVGPEVMAAFQKAGIVARPEEKEGQWSFIVRGQGTQRLNIDLLLFSRLPQMEWPHWAAIEIAMRSKYAQRPKAHPRPSEGQQTPPESQDAETTTDF